MRFSYDGDGPTGGYRSGTPHLREAGSPNEPAFKHPLISVAIDSGQISAFRWPEGIVERRLRSVLPAPEQSLIHALSS